MWGACVDVYQLLNWKMHGETLKFNETIIIIIIIIIIIRLFIN